MTSLLPERFAQRLIEACEQESSVSKVVLFGSRARGDHRSSSDIDLAIEGGAVPLRLNTKLREAAGLYKLDIVHLDSLDNPELAEEIRREGIIVYDRDAKG